jgi:hypothetical protein
MFVPNHIAHLIEQFVRSLRLGKALFSFRKSAYFCPTNNVSLFKVIVLFCGFSLLVTMAVMMAFMGWFVGTGLVVASALMILCGGLLFR